MKIFSLFVSILTILVIITSCNNSKTTDINQLIVDPSIPFEKNIFEIIKDVDVLKLSSTVKPNFIFSKITKIIKFDTNYFHLGDNNKIYKTTDEGVLIATLFEQGLGPNEYREIKDFDINSKGEIYIYDFQKQRFLIYDINFRYIRTESIGYNFMYFKFIKNDFLILSTNKHRNKIDTEFYDYDIFILDNNFNIINTYIPFDHQKFETIRLHSNQQFFKIDTLNLFNDLISDTIYSISNSKIKPYKYFFYRNRSFSEELKKASHEEILKKINNEVNYKNYDFFATLAGASKDFMIYKYAHGRNVAIYSFVSTQTSKVLNYKFPKNLNSSDFRNFLNIKLVEKDTFVSLIYPYVLEYLKKEYLIKYKKEDNFTDKIDSILKNTEPDGNQILVKFKIKKF